MEGAAEKTPEDHLLTLAFPQGKKPHTAFGDLAQKRNQKTLTGNDTEKK
jgi:hypothetical protein